MALIDGVVAYYKMDDDAANTDVDDEINAHEGTLFGGNDTEDLSVAGKIGKALDFNTDYVELANEAGLRFNAGTDDFSVFLWMRRGGGGANQAFIDKRDGANDGWRFVIQSNVVQFFLNARVVNSADTITDIVTWHHIGFTCDRDGNAQIYIDGNANGAAVAMGGEAMATTVTPRIASRSIEPPDAFFVGELDEFGIWDKVLTGDEITALWNDGDGLAYPFAVGTNMQINISDAWKDIDTIQINIGDVWKDVVQVQQNIGDVWKTVFG